MEFFFVYAVYGNFDFKFAILELHVFETSHANFNCAYFKNAFLTTRLLT